MSRFAVRVRCALLVLSALSAMSSPLVAPAAAQTPPDIADHADWGRVLRLSPGTLVLVLAGDGSAPSVPRVVVATSPSGLTLLNLTRDDLPPSARRALHDIATAQPDYFARAAAGNTVVFDNVRLAGDGVFVRDRRVASLGDIVTTMARVEVRELATRRRGRGFWGHLGPLGGYFLGGLGGGFIAASACRCDGGFLPGMVIGGVTGAAAGWRAAHRQTDDVIYRRPTR